MEIAWVSYPHIPRMTPIYCLTQGANLLASWEFEDEQLYARITFHSDLAFIVYYVLHLVLQHISLR